nr:unnamed protein product [Digitaria exilis]
MEVVKLRSSSGLAKVTGVVLCLAGVLVLALYIGPGISPINHHRIFAAQVLTAPSRATWVKGTFLIVLANMSWSLWIVKQAAVLKEYPNKMLMMLSQCIFSTVQSFIVAVVAERDFSKWKLRLDISLLAIIYTVITIDLFGLLLSFHWVYCEWAVILSASMVCGDERPCLLELTVWTPLCLIFTILCSSILGETVHLGSILGGILLVGGLYCMLWGKSKETKTTAPCNKVNAVDIVIQDEQEHVKSKDDKKGTEEQKETTITIMVEQIKIVTL